VFWEAHNPTQVMGQGNDHGTQYRTGIYTFGQEQQSAAQAAKDTYGAALKVKGFAPIATEILPAPTFYFAEAEHQQYLAKNPGGYCGLNGTGVSCSIGTGVDAAA
jgi:peptide-methionine (S)-S-oxide reductase